MKKIIVNNLIQKNTRIDLFLAFELNTSRSSIIKKIKDKKILLNNKQVIKPKTLINNNDFIIILEDTVKDHEIKAYDYELDIVYEDEYVMVVNKKSGMLTHPTSFNESNTLMNAVKSYFAKKQIVFENSLRYGIVHRLDKDTSGLILIAKNNDVEKKLITAFKNNQITRQYYALIKGHLTHDKVEVDIPIKRSSKNINKMETSLDFDAKNAITIFEKIIDFDTFSLVSCQLKTGRTHQIRVHAKYLKNYIINDPLYGIDNSITSYKQYLHAYKIKFIHPITQKENEIKTDLPQQFIKYIKEKNNV